MRNRIATAIAVAALTTLAACDKPAPPVEETNNSSAAVENVDEPEAPPPANVAVPAETNTTAEMRDAPPAPDAQTQEDADAVGMTAHVKRDEAGNTTAPQ